MSTARERVDIAVLQVRMDSLEKKLDSVVTKKADKTQVEEVIIRLDRIDEKLDSRFVTRNEVNVLRGIVVILIAAVTAMATVLLVIKK